MSLYMISKTCIQEGQNAFLLSRQKSRTRSSTARQAQELPFNREEEPEEMEMSVSAPLSIRSDYTEEESDSFEDDTIYYIHNSTDGVTNQDDRRALAAIQSAAGWNGSEFHGTIKVAWESGRIDSLFCKRTSLLPQEIGKLSKLQRLNLVRCPKLKCLPTGILELKNLKHLDLRGCKNLKDLPSKPGMFPNLFELVLRDCSRLRFIPREILMLPGLCWLDIRGCTQLENTAQDIGETSWSLTRIFADFCLEEELEVYASLNRSGARRLLRANNVPLAIWAIALGKVSYDKRVLHMLLTAKPDLLRYSGAKDFVTKV